MILYPYLAIMGPMAGVGVCGGVSLAPSLKKTRMKATKQP
jgi:hypothetical protein